MSFASKSLASLAAALLAVPALAGDIMIHDSYARSSGPNAKAGAAFMTLMNHGDTDDRLIAVRTDAAARAELHTHKENDQGVMQMRHVEDGFAIPAGGEHALSRGGDHVMLMGLTGPLEQGGTVTLTLVFETAGEMTVEVPVDLKRKAKGHGHGHSHSD
ncbi:MAG: copper chaperone PCu(A)C [Paracoccaceae bacterium]